jgi:hypothetical protein
LWLLLKQQRRFGQLATATGDVVGTVRRTRAIEGIERAPKMHSRCAFRLRQRSRRWLMTA